VGVHVCACLHVCVRDSVCLWQSRQSTGGWVCVCLCLCLCGQLRTSTDIGTLSAQCAGARVCLSVHVHVHVMLQGLCILCHVLSMTNHCAVTTGADIPVGLKGMSVCLSETVCLSFSLSVG